METFVVRVWTPGVPEPFREDGAISGVVEHVASGRRTSFSDAGQLLAFLGENARRGEPAPAGPSGEPTADGP